MPGRLRYAKGTGKRSGKGDCQRMAAVAALTEQDQERAVEEAVVDGFMVDDPPPTGAGTSASADLPTHSHDGIALHLSSQAGSGYRGVFRRSRDP
eukprot:7377369-Prymnesium_polylepis.1